MFNSISYKTTGYSPTGLLLHLDNIIITLALALLWGHNILQPEATNQAAHKTINYATKKTRTRTLVDNGWGWTLNDDCWGTPSRSCVSGKHQIRGEESDVP
jgi:hypothetical protein